MTSKRLNLGDKPEKCQFFKECKAPLCPLNEGSKEITWFPDEPICRVFSNLDWVKMQKKLQRERKEGFFNIEMLVVMKRVADGIDPDSRETPGAWIRRRSKL